MSTLNDIRLVIRQRANFACEFCGVTETDTGSELTIDHFRPRTKGGTDDLDNLLYCCMRYNQHTSFYDLPFYKFLARVLQFLIYF